MKRAPPIPNTTIVDHLPLGHRIIIRERWKARNAARPWITSYHGGVRKSLQEAFSFYESQVGRVWIDGFIDHDNTITKVKHPVEDYVHELRVLSLKICPKCGTVTKLSDARCGRCRQLLGQRY